MSTISASTTSTTAYKVTADTTGALVLQTGATPTTAVTISSAQVATFAQAPVLPSASIPQAALAAGVAGNGPAFSAYSSAGQTLSANTFTKLQFNTEEFDTASCYASDRFTPNVAGYYQTGGGFGGGAAQCTTIVAIYKNGSRVKIIANSPSVNPASYGTALVYLNGTTDYIELYGVLSVGQITGSGADGMYFQAVMVRSG
jgi:hypothetical protein